MILTVTLNAAVDKTYRVENFTLDRVHRPSEWRIVAGGKGINVARVYQTLGGKALATGFLGGYNGHFIFRSLQDEGIEGDFVRTHEESRVCIAIVDPTTNSQTEINEVGPVVSPREVANLKRAFRRLLGAQAFEFVTLSGSIPPGVPDTIYAEFIQLARAANIRCILDASGTALQHGVEARPWMVKPNIFEFTQLLGTTPDSEEKIVEAAEQIRGTGVEVVCVTRSRESVVCASDQGCFAADPPQIDFVSAVGSGDAFLGAYLWSIGQKDSIADALKLGIAAGASNATQYGAGFCTAQQIFTMADGVDVRNL